MTRYVVMTISNDGNAAEICETLDEVRETVRRLLTEPDSTGRSLDEEERRQMESDLADITAYSCPSIKGRSAWKEWAYIAPLTEKE